MTGGVKVLQLVSRGGKVEAVGVLLHVGVLRSQSRYGDLVEEELSLVRTDGRVELVDRLTPVVLLTQLLQNLRENIQT